MGRSEPASVSIPEWVEITGIDAERKDANTIAKFKQIRDEVYLHIEGLIGHDRMNWVTVLRDTNLPTPPAHTPEGIKRAPVMVIVGSHVHHGSVNRHGNILVSPGIEDNTDKVSVYGSYNLAQLY